MSKILAVLAQQGGQFRKTAFQTATAAVQLAAEIPGSSVTGVIIGSGITALADQVGPYGVTDVAIVDDPKFSRFSHAAYAAAIASVAKSEGADIVLMPASSAGKDIAPRVAVRLEAGYVPDCVALKNVNGDVIATRPVFAGKARTDVRVTTAIKVFSLRPNVFTARTVNGSNVNARPITADVPDDAFRAVVTETMMNTGKLDVAEADIIVSGGRGLKAPEHYHLVEELAAELHGAVGASRAVVDAGWRPHPEQVGQTGKTVSPSLYIACGISGAVQHLAGMSSSKFILAINKDKDAPIFSVADYGIVGDVFEVLPALIAELKHFHGG